MYLMLGNEKVLYYDLKEYVIQVINEKLLPMRLYGLISNNYRDISKNIKDLKEYLSSRVLNLGRDNADLIYRAYNIDIGENDIDTRVKVCEQIKGLSLTDSYWLTDKEDDRYNINSLRGKQFDLIYETSLYGNKPVGEIRNILSPELTTNGRFKKAWIRENGRLYLIKSDKHENNINTRMEVLASDILKCFYNRINCIEYRGIDKEDANGLYLSKCECFGNDRYSFIEADEVIEYCKRNNIDFKNVLGYSKEVASIAILDYILVNTDRHSRNYGFWMENSTGCLMNVAPLFDFNCALVADTFNRDVTDTISQMFNDGRTLKQVAEGYIPYSKLALNISKFRRLQSKYSEYEYILDNVLDRAKEMQVIIC